MIPEKVDKINRRISSIKGEYIEKYFTERDLCLMVTLDGETAYRGADFVIIAALTNCNSVKNFFDTHHIEDVIDLVIGGNTGCIMLICSCVTSLNKTVAYNNSFPVVWQDMRPGNGI